MVEEVRKQLEKIGLKKPCGSDDLPMEVVKVIASDNMAYPKEYNMTDIQTERRTERQLYLTMVVSENKKEIIIYTHNNNNTINSQDTLSADNI